jgi:glycosyltransferase involved in cell wall biosynthesis
MILENTDILRLFTDPTLDPIFAEASRAKVASAWLGHVPFAQWLVAASRPGLIVELGTHNGVSYSAFCDAVLANHLPTRAAAIDTWQGDAQAGFYGEEVYNDFKAFHDPRYASFSKLIRASFDDALIDFDDGSIDLLHIDGEHSYAAVRHDFESWKLKLSDRGIILLHDTQVREEGYGVWQFWAELRQIYPGFEFEHASGLGVLGVGSHLAAPVAALLAETRLDTIKRIRRRFAALGTGLQRETEVHLLKLQLENALIAAVNAERVAEDVKASLSNDLEFAQERKWVEAEIAAQLRTALVEVERLNEALHSAQLTERIAVESVEGLRITRDRAIQERQTILDSTLWRFTAPLRKLSSYLPRGLHGQLRRAMRRGSQQVVPVINADLASGRPDLPPINLPEAEPACVPQARFSREMVVHRIVFVSGEPDIPGHVYRVERNAAAFSAAGASVSWMRIVDSETRLAEIATASIVVIWRAVNSPTVERLVAAVREAGALLIFDVDDLMFRPELARAEIIDAIRSQNMVEAEVADFFQRVQQVLVQADACFTSTDDLAIHAQRFERLTFVLPNGFDAESLRVSRLAVRRRRLEQQHSPADIVRIGYAAGTRTHQKDFKEASGAVARILNERPDCRLVLFRSQDGSERMFDTKEFPVFSGLEDRVEWRDLVALADLPNEIARFDINIAPLELGNPFVSAKSELKFFEAALVEVPTVASPTGPLRRAIRDGETGYLATTETDWYTALTSLLDDPAARRKMAHAAYLDVLWRFGPERRAEAARSILQQLDGGPEGACAFELEYRRAAMPRPVREQIPPSEIVFEQDCLGTAEVTVIIPLYNYTQFIMEALESVRQQSLKKLDLIVIDDCSTDGSLSAALYWARLHAKRFNRLVVMRNTVNRGLAFTRNIGFDNAETAFVLPLDADNRLLEDCLAKCLNTLLETNAAFVYPKIRNFGDHDHLIGDKSYSPMRLAAANYIDAMALVRKSVWAAVGGFAAIRFGWEDYDFWCRCAEQGLSGVQINEVLAEYRHHNGSMLRTITDIPANKLCVIDQLEQNHSWLRQSREF